MNIEDLRSVLMTIAREAYADGMLRLQPRYRDEIDRVLAKCAVDELTRESQELGIYEADDLSGLLRSAPQEEEKKS